MTISFDRIPVDLRVPSAYIEIDASRAVQGLVGMPSRILVLGQMLAGGSATAEAPVKVLSADQAATLFGRASQLHRMFGALKEVNTWTETWAIPVIDDPAGTAAAGSVLFAGAATAAGTVALWVGGRRVRVGVSVGDTAAEVCTAAAAAVAADPDAVCVAAANGVTPERLDITARHKGVAGNHIDLRIGYYDGEVLPAGITATVTAMSGGTANPDIGDAIAAMGETWYTDIVVPWTDPASLTAIETELSHRFGPLAMRDAHAFAAAGGTHATLTTLGNSRNSPHLTIIARTGSPTPPEEWAAALAGVAAYYTHIDPARPLQTLPLAGVLPPPVADRFTLEERNLLLKDGIATFQVDDGGRVLIERVITTYETNAFGIEDPAYLDVTTLKTLAYLRYQTRARILLRFPRHKLAADGTRYGAGQAIVTPKVIRAELIALYRELEAAGLVEDLDQFRDDLLVEIDANDPNRINALVPPNIVNQFRVFAGKIQFRL